MKRVTVACRGTSRMTVVKSAKKASSVVLKASIRLSRSSELDMLRMDIVRINLKLHKVMDVFKEPLPTYPKGLSF